MYDKGTRIYYTGDAANQPGYFEVVRVDSVCLDLVEVGVSSDYQRRFGEIPFDGIGTEYHGHCNPRFVTFDALNEYRRERGATPLRWPVDS